METCYCEGIRKIKQNQKKLEKALKVKLLFSGKKIEIEGDAISEYLCLEIIEAIELGFTAEQALLLCDEELVFEKINIKNLTKRRDLERIRARIIGTKGKTKKYIQNLSDCFICLHDNVVGIIGRSDDIKKAIHAITYIIQGKKQGKVYNFLEQERTKNKKRALDEDLGLRK